MISQFKEVRYARKAVLGTREKKISRLVLVGVICIVRKVHQDCSGFDNIFSFLVSCRL